MVIKLRKTVRSASYLTTRPRLLSPLQRSNLSIFQLSPGFSLIFFPIEPSYPVPFHWVGNSSGIFQPAPHPVSFDWVGISLYLSTEPYSLSRSWVGMPRIFNLTAPPPPTHTHQYPFYWEGAGNLLHHQIKLRISTNMGNLKTRRDLPKFVHTPREGRWVQGATAGTKAPVPHGVQSKEGSLLWVPLWSP